MNNLLNASMLFLKRNSSTILTCIGGAGVVATSILAVKATPTAMTRLAMAKEEKGEDLTTLEKVQVAGPAYIPAVLVGASTVACIFGANILNHRQQAGLMSAYALLDSSYKEYKNKVIDLYGEEADARVREEIGKDKFEETDIDLEFGTQLYYDEFSGRYFNSTPEKVIAAEYAINRKISLNSGAYLNEWYEALDIPGTDYGAYLGWSEAILNDYQWSNWLEFHHETRLIDDDLECCAITMSVEPMCDFEYY